jgi:hypothetical protein
MLDHGPEEVVAQLLIDRLLVTDPVEDKPWPVKVNDESTNEDESVTVSGYDGKIDGRSMPTGRVHSHPAVQIKVKGRDQVTARAKAKAIAHEVDENVYHAAVTLEGKTYCVQSIGRTSTFNFAGKETAVSQRNVFTLNALVTIRQTS